MSELDFLWDKIEGEAYENQTFRILYATDASEYREIPLGVVYPKNNYDLGAIVQWAAHHKIPLIPRAGGTSLAGQVVGNGLIVDISKYFKNTYDLDTENQTIWVQAGVVRDDLNQILKPDQLFFAPETSTSNRACIGGMFGNNSCGGNSLIYGSTRHHVLEAKGFLSDGSFVHFKNITEEEWSQISKDSSFEATIYKSLFNLLHPEKVIVEINQQFPDSRIRRRNSGYAIDDLVQNRIFQSQNKQLPDLNLCQLIAGSEGTLTLITDIKIKLTPISNDVKAVIGVHCDSISDVLHGNLIALNFQPTAVELIDHTIIQLSLENQSQKENVSVLTLDPNHPEIHILAIEFSEKDPDLLQKKCDTCIEALKLGQIGYSYPILQGRDLNKIWKIRKAGLGIMSNLKGDAKPKSFVEDSVVLPEQLPSYFAEFESICKNHGIKMVAYGHISTGEIHKKPILDIQNPQHFKLFHELALADAHLVKKYHGSLSGEHGDGRLRGEFLPLLLGKKIVSLFQEIKTIFDPDSIFNPGKIVNTPRMDQFLRETPSSETIVYNTYFHFPETDGWINALKKCCNSGDCRKSASQDGTLCPSFQAQNEEYFSTRARANLLREMILNTRNRNPYSFANLIQHDSDLVYSDQEIYDILSWCLACKACKDECPSQVDMTKLRAEFLQHYYDRHRIPFRSWIIGHYPLFNEWASYFSGLYNFIMTQKWSSKILKKMVGFASQRSLPTIHKRSLLQWHNQRENRFQSHDRKVYLFPDEFTNRNDVEIGKKGIYLLEKLGYEVIMISSSFSGRTYLSKGMLKQARRYAEKNVAIYKELISEKIPLIGIEPSAILTFRDEYPDLLSEKLQLEAQKLAQNCFLIDEFIMKEWELKKFDTSLFTDTPKKILFHAHCYQKALSDKTSSVNMMEIPKNYTVKLIEDGCCGMAGSFGFEKEHFEMSQKIGSLKLFPAIENKKPDEIITACGTSCRHQIKDGTGEISYHPIEILFDALI
ncbi:MAG: linked oxidase domain protein [Bacteroidetes bacterium]|nr:linked oxidase domain protein [Bacteroidota bacterium]